MFMKNLVNFKIFTLIFMISSVLAASEARGPMENIGGFLGGTIVHTLSGPDTIQNIHVNDRVASFDATLGRVTNSRVADIHQFEVDSLCHIQISGETYYLNPDHRFYLPKKNLWIAAKHLEGGVDYVLSLNGDMLPVESISVVAGKETLFELSVESTENYFVGSNKVLVHNFVMVIPVATWVIGEGIAWASAATIAASIATIAIIDSRDQNAYRKSDIEEIDYVSKDEGIERHEFRHWVHENKSGRQRSGRENDYTREELRDLAREYKQYRGKDRIHRR